MSRFFKPTPYNNETKNQMWMSMIADGHDICCSCPTPFAHLLDSIFPDGHSDRNKTIAEIIDRDYQLCHSGGEEETNLGMAAGTSAATLLAEREEEGTHTKEENIEELIAAVEDAERR